MRLNGVEAFVVEHRLDVAVRGRIAVMHGDDVGAERQPDRRIVLQGIGVSLADQFAADISVRQPLGDAVNDCVFQRVVMQHHRVDEAREFALALHDLFGFLANARPHRIEPARAR